MFTFALIDCGSTKVPRIASILQDNDCQVHLIPLAEANGCNFANLNGMVMSGGPHLFTNKEVGEILTQQFEFLDNLHIPTLGICLGHQAFAVRRGYGAFLGEERREDELIQVHSEHPLFDGIPARVPMRTDHCEGIPLPAGFRIIASSQFYEVEAMASMSLPHFGVQFHPEVSGEFGRILIRNFCNLAKTT